MRGKQVHGFDPSKLFGNGFDLGSVDLIQGGLFRQVVGRSVIALLCTVDKDECRIFKRATIVLPPVSVTHHTKESVFTALEQAVKELRGYELDDQAKLKLSMLVQIVHSPSLEIADLLAIAQEQEKRTLVAIADASQYRDFSLTCPANFGISAVRISEDRWVPHVTTICQQLVTIEKKLEGYGLIHVPEVPAQKSSNISLLTSIEDCYVAELNYEDDPADALYSKAQRWKSMVLLGQLPDVEAEIDKIGLPDGTRLHLLAQLVQGTGRDSTTIDIITQIKPFIDNLNAGEVIQLARLAHKAGNDDLAHEILPAGPNSIGEQLWLEEGLELSTYFKDNARITLFDSRLAELFPHSDRLRENRDRRLFMNVRQGNIGSTHHFTASGFTDNHLLLQEKLSIPKPNYEAVIEESKGWGQEWLELTIVCCAMHALSVDTPAVAANLACHITASELYGRQATNVLIEAIKLMMLEELIPQNNNDYYRSLFQTAFQYLAHHPQDGRIRLTFANILTVESSGDIGIPLMTLTMLDLAQNVMNMERAQSSKADAPPLASDSEIKISMENGFSWLHQLGAAEPGVTVIPRHLLTANPDDIVQYISKLVDLSSNQIGEDADLTFMEQLVLLACAISPYATHERDEDIRLVRQLACHFTTEGQFQKARNLAEAVLQMGQSCAYRRRLSWQAFGDIYHRCHNPVMALIGLASALAVDVAVMTADIWHEVYTIHRVLRDMGLFELSKSFLPMMEVILSDLGYEADTDPHYVNALLGLQLMQADSATPEPLYEILAKITDACRKELGNRSRLLPLAALLGQAVYKAKKANLNIPLISINTLNEAATKVGSIMANRIIISAAREPSASDVLSLFNSIERSSYASDVSRDYYTICIVARKLLNTNSQCEITAKENIFAIELLADHTVTLLSVTPTMTVGWPIQYALQLNQANLDVAFLALDSHGELSVNVVSNGHIRAIEQSKQEYTFRHRFDSWLKDYPRNYGRVDPLEGNNIFYLTMEKLDVRLPQSERLVIVAEPYLQQLTANLVVVQPEGESFSYFTGTKGAIGVVPSLSWLSAASDSKRSGRGAYRAWISTEKDFERVEELEIRKDCALNDEPLNRESPLDIAFSRLSGCFEDFGFVVDTGCQLPCDMRNAPIAVVTAHGGLNKEGRYLHSIRDDGDLIVAPAALAAALAGVELVILFVCSGGRIDKNPLDNSTTSLPKQLLNNGCRTVIASAWPLNVMVTYNWLEPFLHAWEAGSTALDATKVANDHVAQRLGDFPQYFLAMRVYGDILLTKSHSTFGIVGHD